MKPTHSFLANSSRRPVITGVALALLTAGVLLAGCSKEESDDPVIVQSGGTPGNAGGNAGGSANTAGTAGDGSGGAAAGAGGGSGGGNGCMVAGQVPIMGMCACPMFKPTECSTGCVNTMSDIANCGGCEMPCDPGAACSAGNCTTAPTEVATLTGCMAPRMTLADGVLYIADSGTGKIQSVATTAGSTPMDLVTGETMPGAIAADANGVYWTTGDISADPAGPGAIRSAPLAGGAAVTLVDLDEASRGIAVGGDMVFFTHQNEVFKVSTTPVAGEAGAGTAPHAYMCTAEDTALGRMPFPLGPAVPPATYVCSSDESCSEGGLPAAIAVNGTRILYVIEIREGVESNSIDGDDYVEMGESQGSLFFGAAAVSDTHGYWAAGDHVQRASLTMGKLDQQQVVGTIDFDNVTGFALTATHVYMSSKAGKITRGALATIGDNQVKDPVATGQDGASSVVSDGTNVYWINRGLNEDDEVVGDCKIMSVAIN
jgi:hypothetical protein